MSENETRTAIVVSASSDIGAAICRAWRKNGWSILGTYRRVSQATAQLTDIGVELVHCDLASVDSVKRATTSLSSLLPDGWDCLILCPGTTEPVGDFLQVPFDQWSDAIQVNIIQQLAFVHALLPRRSLGCANGPLVLFFAGGGTNNATRCCSAYTVSKIALTKMCELLDAEIEDTRFSILGPGWVNTKIHEETLRAGVRAGANLERTRAKLAGDECTPMEDVISCINWLVAAPREEVSGRNFSVVYDDWGSKNLSALLRREPDMYKLRRYGNNLLIR